MRFTVQAIDLMAAVRGAAGAAAKKDVIPALCMVRVEATGFRVAVSGTNNEVGVECSAPAVVGEAGACVVPHEELAEWLGRVDGEVAVRLDGDTLRVACGADDELDVPTAEADQWPDFPRSASGAVVRAAGGELKRAFGRALAAVPRQEATRYNLTGVRVEVAGGRCRVVGCDGHKVTIAIDVEGEADGQAAGTVPRAAADLMAQLADGGDAVLTLGKHGAVLVRGRVVVYARLLADRYPPWESVVPKDRGVSFAIDPLAFGAGVRRAAVMTEEAEQRLNVVFEPGRAVLAAGGQRGRSKTAVPVPDCRTDLVTAFMPSLLVAVCRAAADAPGGGMEVEVYDENRPVVFRWAGGTALLMRMVGV